MTKSEFLALLVVLAVVILFPLTIFAYQYLYLPATYGPVKVINLWARVPQAGGWAPEVITVHKGDRVRLRLHSQDVVHGFAIGKMGVDAGPIYPGQVTAVDFVADQAGRFTYYCNVWCSPYHYRMRGILEVVDPVASQTFIAEEGRPQEVEAGLDIDAPHEAEFYPRAKPSAVRGAGIYVRALQDRRPTFEGLGERSPSDVFHTLRREQALGSLSDEELWDLVAYLWSQTTTPERLSLGRALYEKNCAPCHGQTGGGDGPGGRYQKKEPAAFDQAQTMAGGTNAIYRAKIVRGGMGTGMPYWGPIFTDEEIESLVGYLWTFLFSYE